MAAFTGGGRNEPPPEHLVAAGWSRPHQRQTLNAQGEPSIDGKMVLIYVGDDDADAGVLRIPTTCESGQ